MKKKPRIRLVFKGNRWYVICANCGPLERPSHTLPFAQARAAAHMAGPHLAGEYGEAK